MASGLRGTSQRLTCPAMGGLRWGTLEPAFAGEAPLPGTSRMTLPLPSQVAVLTVTLFPIRLLFATFMMLLAWPLAFLASLGSDEREPEQPLALWRK